MLSRPGCTGGWQASRSLSALSTSSHKLFPADFLQPCNHFWHFFYLRVIFTRAFFPFFNCPIFSLSAFSTINHSLPTITSLYINIFIRSLLACSLFCHFHSTLSIFTRPFLYFLSALLVIFYSILRAIFIQTFFLNVHSALFAIAVLLSFLLGPSSHFQSSLRKAIL